MRVNKIGNCPTNLLDCYEEALKEFHDNKMYLDSKLFKTQIEPHYNPLYICLRNKFNSIDLNTVNKEDIKNCDDAMTLYLKFCSQKTNPEFFKVICKYIILYREAFNQYGPEKYKSEDTKQEWEKEYFGHLNKRFFNKSFSELASTEFLPDIVNELYIFFKFNYK